MHEYSLNTKGSSWIMANAGSGKTFMLSRRVVRLLLEGASAESIVCLTYTKAAAAEMRERIIALLMQLAVSAPASLPERLEGMLGEAPTQEQLAIAPTLLETVLDSPLGGMTITTIHGFCQQLLANFPIEAGISPHAALLDDREQYECMQWAMNRLYGSEDAAIRESLGYITLIAAEARLNDWLSAILYRRADWQALRQHGTPAQLLAAVKAQYPALESYDRSEWEGQVLGGITPILAAAIESAAHEVAAKGNDRQNAAFTALRAFLALPADARMEQISAYVDAIGTYQLVTDKAFGKGNALGAVIRAEQERVARLQGFLNILAAVEETYHMAMLASALQDAYEDLKLSRNALDYDDLILAVEQLFANELPWVMTKLDYRIDHLLLDEAQDTSPAQWRISEALVKELLGVDAPSGRPRSLFVVGDMKQSIYSFQGAAPEMFEKMRDDWRKTIPMEAYALSTSYRSTAPVLQLAHAICGVEHTLHREGMAGRVELWPVTEHPARPESIPYAVPETYDESQRAQSVLAQEIAGTIRQWLDEKRELHARGRAVRAGDIMILAPTRKSTPMLIRELQRRNIPVAGIDRLTLSSHLAVRDFMALMQWLFVPEDDLALAQILRSPLIGLSEQQLFELAHARGEASLWQSLRERTRLERWRDLRTLTPYGFLHQLLEVEGLRRAYATRFGHEIHEVLDELLHHAAAQEGESISLFAYARQLQTTAKEIKRELAGGTHADEVRVMTVHGAKGLEAPIVFLVDTTRKPDGSKEYWCKAEDAPLPYIAISDEAKEVKAIAVAKEARQQARQQEYERLLYVAITRAEDELYIAGVQPSVRQKKPSEGSWYALCKAALSGIAQEEEGKWVLACPQESAHRPEHLKEEHAMAPLPSWAGKSAPQEIRAVSFSPSRLANAELALYDSTGGDARKRGVIIHQLLELASHDPQPAILSKLVRHLAPDWKDAERESMVRDLHALLSHSEYAWLWRSEGYNELGISGALQVQGETRWMNGQIDRLVMAGNKIVVLDYKTSTHVPASIAETPLNYLLQMKAYKELLAKKYKDKTICCALLWTHAPRLDWLDEAIAEISWEQLAQAA